MLLVASFAACPPWLEAQEPAPAGDQSDAERAAEPDRVREVGGRLVISSEAVVVATDLDEPLRTSSLATKTDTPLLRTARSISVLDRQQLDDLQAVNVTQAHDYTLGFTPEDERGPAFDRGFRVGFYDLRRDGLRTYTWSVREPVALDRIQYLRGPAALLYGDGSPGGLVNLVLKKPLPVARHQASVAAGELGYLRVTADLTGPLSDGRGVRYRLVGAAEGLGNGFDNDESRISVLPMVSLDFGPDVTLHLDGEYYDQRGRGYRHFVPATPESERGDFSRIPWDVNVASPDDGWRGWNASGGLRLDARLSERASLHVAGRYTRIDGDLDVHGLSGIADGGRTAQRFRYREISRWDEYQSDSFAVIAARTGAIGHRVVIGVEAGLSTVDSRIGVGGGAPLDLLAPVYAPRAEAPPLAATGSDLVRLGSYVQDQVELGRRWTIVPALRFSRLRLTDRAAAAASRPDAGRTTTDVATPSLGAVFLPWPWLSVWGSWSEGFEPPAPGQYREDGSALEPVESRSIEAGVKGELLPRRLGVSATAFGIRQTNVAEADPTGFYRQIAEGESRGIEVEANGSPARGLSLRAGYSWTRTEITRDLGGFAGNALPNAPEHQAHLWMHRRWTAGPLRGLALGAGVVYVSDRFSTRANAIRLPAYTRVDATASYARPAGRFALALAAQNLTNTRYVTGAAGLALYAGQPRRLAVTLSTSF